MGVFILATPEEINNAIADAITEPASTSIEGESMTEHSIPDKIAGAKFSAGQQAIAAINQGYWPFARIIMRPPGAGGR